jgi:ubiquinone/menaquinone biosynthesis C-methylase UbiE
MVAIEEIEYIRRPFLKYTRKAFRRLPNLGKCRILDVGCGSGVPTVELAKLSDGEVVGIDIDQSCINKLNQKILEQNLSNRVRALCVSVFKVDFADESFDVIWSEGILSGIDFETTLKNWRRLLKRNGYLVIHYQVLSVKDLISRIPKFGYTLVDTVLLPKDIWWTQFYKPLEEKMSTLHRKYASNLDALTLLKQCQREIVMVKENPRNFSSAFYILKKA